MSAADHLREAIEIGCTRDDHDHIAAHRAEVLAEAADAIEKHQAAAEAKELQRFQFLDHETELAGDAVRAAAALLRGMAEPKPRRQQEDPHTSPLHRDYLTPHDLPPFPHQQDRRWL